MKKSLFLAGILILLFVFGILMYDFSDELDTILINNKWYVNNEAEIYTLSLKNNKFDLIDEKNESVKEYKNCTSYQYNSNVSMIKLKCDGIIKKIYISSYDNDKLVLNENGIDKYYYSNKEIALIDQFKEINGLSDSDYNNLISINFNDNLFINYKKFNSLLKSKNKVYVGIVTNNINYENVYNYQVLNNLINNSSKNFYLLSIDKLSEEELDKLNKETKQINYEDKIYVYEVSKKGIKSKVTIDINNKNDLGNYKEI